MPPCWIHVSSVEETEVSLVSAMTERSWSQTNWISRERPLCGKRSAQSRLSFDDVGFLSNVTSLLFWFICTQIETWLPLQNESPRGDVLACYGSTRKTAKWCRQVTKVTGCYFEPTWFVRLKAIFDVVEIWFDHVFFWPRYLPIILRDLQRTFFRRNSNVLDHPQQMYTYAILET